MDARVENVSPARAFRVVDPLDLRLRSEPLRQYDRVDSADSADFAANRIDDGIESQRVTGHAVDAGLIDGGEHPKPDLSVRSNRFLHQNPLASGCGCDDQLFEQGGHRDQYNRVDIVTRTKLDRVRCVLALALAGDLLAGVLVTAADRDELDAVDVPCGVAGVSASVTTDPDDSHAQLRHGGTIGAPLEACNRCNRRSPPLITRRCLVPASP